MEEITKDRNGITAREKPGLDKRKWDPMHKWRA